jgi:calcium/calmodulin-dependent protein kinase kinase 2
VLEPASRPLPEPRSLNYFRQLLLAVEFLHHHHIIHRDIKPANILLCSDDVIKLSDFGISHIFADEDTLTKSAGTPAFSPPETRLGTAFEGRPVDVWAMGVTLFALLFARLPFVGSDHHLPTIIAEAEPDFTPW